MRQPGVSCQRPTTRFSQSGNLQSRRLSISKEPKAAEAFWSSLAIAVLCCAEALGAGPAQFMPFYANDSKWSSAGRNVPRHDGLPQRKPPGHRTRLLQLPSLIAFSCVRYPATKPSGSSRSPDRTLRKPMTRIQSGHPRKPRPPLLWERASLRLRHGQRVSFHRARALTHAQGKNSILRL